MHAPFMNTKCGKLNSVLCIVVAVVVNCISSLLLLSAADKNGKKASDYLPVFPSVCSQTKMKTKKTLRKRSVKAFCPKKQSLWFESIFFSLENQSISIKFQFNVITNKCIKFWGQMHFICATFMRRSLREEVHLRPGLHLKLREA